MSGDDQIDYTKLEAIPHKQTIICLNQFIANTVRFYNKFGEFSENEINHFENEVKKIESKLQLLEAKLNSLPPQYYQNLPQESDYQQMVIEQQGYDNDNRQEEVEQQTLRFQDDQQQYHTQQTEKEHMQTQQISAPPLFDVLGLSISAGQQAQLQPPADLNLGLENTVKSTGGQQILFENVQGQPIQPTMPHRLTEINEKQEEADSETEAAWTKYVYLKNKIGLTIQQIKQKISAEGIVNPEEFEQQLEKRTQKRE